MWVDGMAQWANSYLMINPCFPGTRNLSLPCLRRVGDQTCFHSSCWGKEFHLRLLLTNLRWEPLTDLATRLMYNAIKQHLQCHQKSPKIKGNLYKSYHNYIDLKVVLAEFPSFRLQCFLIFPYIYIYTRIHIYIYIRAYMYEYMSQYIYIYTL